MMIEEEEDFAWTARSVA